MGGGCLWENPGGHQLPERRMRQSLSEMHLLTQSL